MHIDKSIYIIIWKWIIIKYIQWKNIINNFYIFYTNQIKIIKYKVRKKWFRFIEIFKSKLLYWSIY